MDQFLKMSIETRFDLYMDIKLREFMGKPLIERVISSVEQAARDTIDAIAIELDFKLEQPVEFVWAKNRDYAAVVALTSVGILTFTLQLK